MAICGHGLAPLVREAVAGHCPPASLTVGDKFATVGSSVERGLELLLRVVAVDLKSPADPPQRLPGEAGRYRLTFALVEEGGLARDVEPGRGLAHTGSSNERSCLCRRRLPRSGRKFTHRTRQDRLSEAVSPSWYSPVRLSALPDVSVGRSWSPSGHGGAIAAEGEHGQGDEGPGGL